MFSLNFTSIEIEEERGSVLAKTNVPWRGEDARKWTRLKKWGAEDQNSAILSERIFWMSPCGCSPVNLLPVFRTTFYKNTFVDCLYLLNSLASLIAEWWCQANDCWRIELVPQMWGLPLLKKDSGTCTSYVFCKILKSTFFTEQDL